MTKFELLAKAFLLACSISTIFSSCSDFAEESSFVEVISFSQNHPNKVIVVTSRQYHTLHPFDEPVKIFYSDLQDYQNIFMEYSLNLTSNSNLIFVFEQGLVTDVFRVISKGKLEKIPIDYDLLNSKVYASLFILGETSWLEKGHLNHLLQSDDFYSSYLLSRYYSILDEQTLAKENKNKAISFFEEHNPTNFILLYYEICDNNESRALTLDKSISDPIVLSLKKDDEEAQFCRGIFNPHANDIYIFQVDVSCSCLSVDYDKVIHPKETGKLTVSYHPSGGEKGSLVKTISILTNAQPNVIVIPVKITI